MIREFNLKNLTNEKAEAITRMLDQQTGPTISLSKARSEFPTLPIDLNVYEKIAQESEKRKRKLTMTEWLEMQDPSEKYRPVLINGSLKFLDAFERQLMVRDLVVSGPDAIECAAFFSSSSNRTLFPEFVNRNILAGRLEARNRVTTADLVAERIQIDSITYENLTADWDDADVQHASIGEGAPFPETTLTLGEREIRLQKFGGKIKGTYEYFRRVRANQFALTLRFIGTKWEKDKAEGAVDVIINGNTGNSNPAENTNVAVSGTLDYADFFRWYLAGEFNKDLFIASETRVGDIGLMDEFKDSNLFDFPRTGILVMPFGRRMVISDSAEIGDDLIAAIDQEAALIEVAEHSSSITETQKIMDGQFEEILFSQYIGYSKVFEGASQTLTITF